MLRSTTSVSSSTEQRRNKSSLSIPVSSGRQTTLLRPQRKPNAPPVTVSATPVTAVAATSNPAETPTPVVVETTPVQARPVGGSNGFTMSNGASSSSTSSSSSAPSPAAAPAPVSKAWLLFLIILSALAAWKFSNGAGKLAFDGPLEVDSCVQSTTHSLCLSRDASLCLYKGSYDAPPEEDTEPLLSLLGGQKKGKYLVEVEDGRMSLLLSKKGFGDPKPVDNVSLLDHPTLLHMI